MLQIRIDGQFIYVNEDLPEVLVDPSVCPDCREYHGDEPDWNCLTGHYGVLDGDNHCEDYRCCIQ